MRNVDQRLEQAEVVRVGAHARADQHAVEGGLGPLRCPRRLSRLAVIDVANVGPVPEIGEAPQVGLEAGRVFFCISLGRLP